MRWPLRQEERVQAQERSRKWEVSMLKHEKNSHHQVEQCKVPSQHVVDWVSGGILSISCMWSVYTVLCTWPHTGGGNPYSRGTSLQQEIMLTSMIIDPGLAGVLPVQAGWRPAKSPMKHGKKNPDGGWELKGGVLLVFVWCNQKHQVVSPEHKSFNLSLEF